MSEQQSGLKEMRERISGYHVYDRHYEKVGKVDDLFVDANDELEYIGLKMGGMLKSKTALVPMELVRINDRRDLIEIEADKKQIEDSPTFGKDDEITSEYESEVYRHFGLQSPDSSGERGSYADYDESDAGEGRREESHREEGSIGSGEERDDDDVDTEYGERAGAGHHHDEAHSSDRRGEERSSRSEGFEEPIRESSGAATGESAGAGDGSREPSRTGQRTDDIERGDEYSPRSSRSEESGRDRSGAAESGRREDSSSGSSGGPRVRKRLKISSRREEAVDAPDGTVGSGEDTGRRVR